MTFKFNAELKNMVLLPSLKKVYLKNGSIIRRPGNRCDGEGLKYFLGQMCGEEQKYIGL